MNTAILHYYRQYRAHQNEIATSGGGALSTYPSGRTELSFGSAPYGQHALSAYTAAKRTIYFRKDLARMVKGKKRK
ncbi:hypothetical protein Brsp07_04529 [Brucella sp. NBRC 14130]|uniref:hypothetical protein n=1 Tax=Brucella sp. NBRC 14130 TaxID=3075483 RepID=UPI0030A85CC0